MKSLKVYVFSIHAKDTKCKLFGIFTLKKYSKLAKSKSFIGTPNERNYITYTAYSNMITDINGNFLGKEIDTSTPEKEENFIRQLKSKIDKELICPNWSF